MLRREEENARNVGLRSNLAQERRVAANVGASSSLAERREMLRREEENARNVGLRSNLAQERRVAANVGATSNVAAGQRNSRVIASMQSDVRSLDASLDDLPRGIQNRFIPIVRIATNELRRMANVPDLAGARIERLRGRLETLSQEIARSRTSMAFGESFGGRGAAGINLGLDQRALGAATAQMQVLQQAMGRLTAEARGPAVAAFNALREATATAFDEGRIDAAATRQELARLRQQAVGAVAGAAGISPRRLGRDVERAGDVARGGVDRWSLALQQAAFAVDDFMSATGGVDMKIRAVQNNVSQLAFVLGGTAGLFIGLGVAITAQAGLALMRWINDGRTAEDQTKALNEALERQKTLVDDLAKSFDDLASAISQSAMSSEAFSGRQLDKQLEEIKRRQKEAREESLYQMNPGVNAARASQNVADKAIKAATTEAEMLAAQNAMARARADEDRAKAAVRSRASGGVSTAEAMSEIVRSFRAEAALSEGGNAARAAGAAGGTVGQVAPSAAAVAATSARLADEWLNRNVGANRGGDVVALRNRMNEMVQSGGDREAIAGLKRAIDILELPLKESADDMALAVSRASSEAASKIKEAQDQVAEAIRAGAPGAAVFSVAIGKTAESLAAAQDKLVAAVNEKDPEQRRAMVEAAKKDVGALSQAIEQQLEASRGMMFGGLGVKGGRGGQLTGIRRVEGAGSVLAALEGSSSFGGQKPQMVAALRSLMTQEQSARSDLSRSMTFGNGGQRMQAAMRLEQVQQQLQQFTEGLPEDIKSGADAAKAATKEATKDAKTREEMVARGRELLASPKQRAMETFRKDMEAASLAAAGPDRDALLNSFVKNRAMEIAPALAELAREREQAITPAYSPALMASDASTAEGQKELNRLLRGEDSSKDKNLDELKKQSELLSEMLEVAKRDHNVVIDF
jgi:hypothetical protein